MKRMLLLFGLGIIAFSTPIQGQSWEGIGEFNGYAEHLAVDSVNNVLYIGGSFNKVNDTLNVQSICKYDGNTITTIDESVILPDFQENYPVIQDIAVFQGDLYVASHSFQNYGSIEGTPISSQVIRFNGEQWESVFPDIESCQSLRVVDGKLYLFCYWNQGVESDEFIKVYDGEQEYDYLYGTPYPELANTTYGYIRDILKVDTGYVLAGDMSLTTLNNESKWLYLSKDVYFWDGESEVEVFYNEGLNSMSGAFGNNVARRILRYQGEIYVGGAINAFGNVDGTGVVRAGNDGTWYSLSGEGGGTSPHVQSMIVHDGLLWIVGNLLEYREAWGSEPMNLSDIMIWDGETAFRPSDDAFTYPSELFDIIAFQDTVYVAGSFQFINVTPISSVAKFTGAIQDSTVSVNDEPQPLLNIYPNPCTDRFYLEFQSEINQPRNLIIYSITGQRVKSQPLSGGQRHTIDVSGLEAGMYVVHIMDEQHVVGSTKLVLQGR